MKQASVNRCDVSEARGSQFLDVLLHLLRTHHSCVIYFLVRDQKEICASQIFKKGDSRKQEFSRNEDKEESLSEAVKRFLALYDRSLRTFSDKNKKNVAQDDVAKEVDYRDCKKFFEKSLVIFSFLYSLCKFTFFLSHKKLKGV